MLKIIKRNWATEQTRARAIIVHSTTRYPSTAPSSKKLLGQSRRQGTRKRTKLIEKLRGQHLNLKRRKLGKSATQRSSNAVRERFFQQQFVRVMLKFKRPQRGIDAVLPLPLADLF